MKFKRDSRLAIFGGSPAFVEQLHVGRPNLPDHQLIHQRIDEVLQRRWLTNEGECVRELERRIAAAVRVTQCICLCNGAVVLEIASRALTHGFYEQFLEQ